LSSGRVMTAATAGYLLGTLPSADLASRLAGGGVDLRKTGSRNPGAANALQVLGRGWGGAVLVADVGKGALACLVGGALAGDRGAHLGGAAAVVGHCYPAWSRFRGGGKGVAVSTGQCLATFPAYFPVDLAVAYSTVRWRKRAAVAAAVASTTWVGCALLWWYGQWPNAWGPRPSPLLPLAAAASSATIMARFWQGRHQGTRGWAVGTGRRIPGETAEQ
jgi:glycerol-3-phosphate acyltransferase PlsY